MKTLMFAGAVLLGSTMALQAAVVTENYRFSLSGFTDAIGSTAPPITNIAGSFTLRFDPTVAVENSQAGLSNVSVNGIQIGSIYAYSYDPADQFLSFGGMQNRPEEVELGTSDLAIQLYLPTPNNPTLFNCADGFSCGKLTGNTTYSASAYTLQNSSTAYFASEAASSVTSAVPEPSTWAMMLLGFGGLSFLAYRKKCKSSVGVEMLAA